MLFVFRIFTITIRFMRTLLFVVLVVVTMGCQRTRTPYLVGPSMPVGAVDEQSALAIARRFAATNLTWATQAIYTASRRGTGWSVQAKKAEVDRGGYVLILIDERGG